jgi:rhodanese-related sulfurtransferase
MHIVRMSPILVRLGVVFCILVASHRELALKTQSVAETTDLGPSSHMRTVGVDVALRASLNADAISIDTRAPADFAQGHIPAAVNIVSSEDIDITPGFVEKLKSAPIIVVYGSAPASPQVELVVAALQSHTTRTINAYLGGWREWTFLKLPAEGTNYRKE